MRLERIIQKYFHYLREAVIELTIKKKSIDNKKNSIQLNYQQ